MTYTRVYSDRKLLVLQVKGWLVCQCPEPELVWLPQWRDWECARCGKKVMR